MEAHVHTFSAELYRDTHVLVTGGGSGIGLGIAQRFAAAGASVSLVGRNQERLDSAVGSIGKAGTAAAADVRDPEALTAAVNTVCEHFGALDVVVAAAAGNFAAPVDAMSPGGFKAVVDIDLMGTFNTIKAVAQWLRPPASIIAISAYGMPVPLQAHVVAAKAGVDALVQTVAIEWGRRGVRVNAVVPGPIDNTEGMERLAPSDEARQRVVAGVPLGRLGQTDDVADAVLWLASPAAAFVTGVVLPVDGGSNLLGSQSAYEMYRAVTEAPPGAQRD